MCIFLLIGLWQCPKLAWLSKYKPEERTANPGVEARFKADNEVGDLAMGLFGDFTEVTTFKEDGSLNLGKMIDITRLELKKQGPFFMYKKLSISSVKI